MIKDRVTAGSNFTIYADFNDEYGNAQILDAPPSYSIRNSNKALIISGLAAQSTQAYRWQATITIPINSTPGDYTLSWVGTSNKIKYIQNDLFKVIDVNPNYYELDLLLPEKSAVTDALVFDASQTIDSFNVVIQTPDAENIYSSTVTATNSVAGDKNYVKFQSPALVDLTAGNGAFSVYIISYSFLLNNTPQTEHHFLYVVNPKILAYVNELKRKIDRAAIQNPNPALRYNSVDLVAHLNVALQYINSQPPTQTSYTLASVPDTIYSYLLDAAAIQALESRYLAEAEAAFNFNGQPVTLEVDRTGFIDSAIQRYQTRLDGLPAAKKLSVMNGGGSGSIGYGSASGPAFLGLTEGPNTYVYLDPWSNNRMVTYGNVLLGLGYATPYGTTTS